MIQNKPNEPGSNAERVRQLPHDEAATKGKIYNPIDGKELGALILARVRQLLTGRASDDVLDGLMAAYSPSVMLHPSINTEVIAYPKADVHIVLAYTAPRRDIPPDLDIKITVYQHPKEENRGFSIAARAAFDLGEEDFVDFGRLQLDEIPPDALRILNDMPVAVPQRVPATGPSGEAVVIEVPKAPTEQQRAAVQQEYGSKAVDKVADKAANKGGRDDKQIRRR